MNKDSKKTKFGIAGKKRKSFLSPHPLGASIVEMTLVLPMFLMAIFFTIQIIRYFYITFWLEYTALKTARWYAYSDIHVVPDSSCDETSTTLTAECQEYLFKVTEAIRIANSTLKSALGDSTFEQLRSYSFYDSGLYNQNGNCQLSANLRDRIRDDNPNLFLRPRVAILRPGECVISREAGKPDIIINHPTRQCGSCGNDTIIDECINRTAGLPSPVCNEKMEDILKEHPVVVRAEFPMSLGVPFIEDLKISAIGSQVVYSNIRANVAIAPTISIILPPPNVTTTPPPTMTGTVFPEPTDNPEEPTPTVGVQPTAPPCITTRCCWCECQHNCSYPFLNCGVPEEYFNFREGFSSCVGGGTGHCYVECDPTTTCENFTCGSAGGVP